MSIKIKSKESNEILIKYREDLHSYVNEIKSDMYDLKKKNKFTNEIIELLRDADFKFNGIDENGKIKANINNLTVEQIDHLCNRQARLEKLNEYPGVFVCSDQSLFCLLRIFISEIEKQSDDCNNVSKIQFTFNCNFFYNADDGVSNKVLKNDFHNFLNNLEKISNKFKNQYDLFDKFCQPIDDFLSIMDGFSQLTPIEISKSQFMKLSTLHSQITDLLKNKTIDTFTKLSWNKPRCKTKMLNFVDRMLKQYSKEEDKIFSKTI